MSDEAEPILLWVRNEQAKVYGPLSPTSVELLIDNGVLAGRLQVSLDGLNFVFPGRLPGPRMVFPRALWGDVVEPGEAQDAEYARVALPPPLPEAGAPVSRGSGVRAPPGRAPEAPRAPVAGPTATARAGSPYRPSPSRVQPVGSSDSGVRARPVTPPVQHPSRPGVPAPPQRPSVGPSASQRPAAPPGVPPSQRPTMPPDAPSGVGPAPRPTPGSMPTPVPAAPPGHGALPASGSLSEYSPMRLYGLAAATDANALLQLALGDRTILLHFKRGAPELIDSTHPHDALPAFLVAQGLATPAQLEAAEAEKARFGGELLPALFGLGLVNPNVAFQQIAERATAILFRALSAEQGTFTCEARDLPPHQSLPLGNRWALYLEQLRRVPPSDVRRRMMPFMGLPVMRTGGAVAVALGDLKLQPQEARALQFFDGVRSLGQLVGDHPMEADVLARVAWMLRDLDLVAFKGEPVPPSEPSAEPMVPPSVAPSGIRAPPPGSFPSAPPTSTPPTVRADPPPGPPVIVATMSPGPQLVAAPEAPPTGSASGVAAPPGAPSARPAAPPAASSGRPVGPPVAGGAAPPGAPSGRPIGPPVVGVAVPPGAPSGRPVGPPVVSVAAPPGPPPGRPSSPGVAAPPGPPPGRAPSLGVASPPGAPSGRPAAPPGAPPVIGVPSPPGSPGGRPMVPRTVVSAAEPEPIHKASTVPGGPVQAPPRQAVPYPQRPAPGAHTAPVSPARPPPVASSPSVKPSTPPTGVAPSDEVAQLAALLERAKKQSYFELLNVPREADSTAAKVAYFKLAKVYHPDTVPPGSPEALGKLKADLFALIGEAHRTLSDPRLKQEYIAELDSGAQGEKVDVAQLLLAEELFQRGRLLVKARKWADAVKVLDEAIAANAQEGEYFGWRGFARFFLLEDKAKAHPPALRDMEYALKLNPNAAAVHYFQGYLWKMMGDLGRAKAYFKRCVELDPRHIDAQRELRMMK